MRETRETVKQLRVCPLCHQLFTNMDLAHGHLCTFSLARPTPSPWRFVAWGYVGACVLAVGVVLALASLGSL